MSLDHDDGGCASTSLVLVFAAALGFASGGLFNFYNLVRGCAEYDSFLTGGKRREALYLMFEEFSSKLVSIPGEALPLIALALAKYHQPPEHRQPCEADGRNGNAFCAAFFAAEPLNATYCQADVRCSQYFADGTNFVCEGFSGECGITQTATVKWVIRAFIAVVPAFCYFVSFACLLSYPKQAGHSESMELLKTASDKMKRGDVVEDPWRLGSFVWPADVCGQRGENFGKLSYFWPSEFRAALSAAATTSADSGIAYNGLLRHSLSRALLWLFLVPVGPILMTYGVGNESASWMMGIGAIVLTMPILGFWWQGSRVRVARMLIASPPPRSEVIAYLACVQPFEGCPKNPAVATPAPVTLGASQVTVVEVL
eukprot:NODE_2216_length_2265_cov_7.644528.p1 GENE.NODE_2216_length_2265_cov_7.644528~~NODE_2216_length_2265_cov_7.644528.p1  ORF type:complete len:371 (+),score=56.13 NODE_2216_length_2265_cov_7.644528:395-1507(+)